MKTTVVLSATNDKPLVSKSDMETGEFLLRGMLEYLLKEYGGQFEPESKLAVESIIFTE